MILFLEYKYKKTSPNKKNKTKTFFSSESLMEPSRKTVANGFVDVLTFFSSQISAGAVSKNRCQRFYRCRVDVFQMLQDPQKKQTEVCFFFLSGIVNSLIDNHFLITLSWLHRPSYLGYSLRHRKHTLRKPHRPLEIVG